MIYIQVTSTTISINGTSFPKNSVTHEIKGNTVILKRTSNGQVLVDYHDFKEVSNGTTPFASIAALDTYLGSNLYVPINTTVYGSSAVNGTGALTSFAITHGAGFTPTKVFIQMTSNFSSYYISAKTATTFTITFVTAPASGTGNVTFDWSVVL